MSSRSVRSSARRAGVACTAVILFTSQPADAGVGSWTTQGPEGGPLLSLAIDPLEPRTLYAGTLINGVFKSTDGGSTWSAASAGLPAGSGAGELVVDPGTSGTLYATAAPGVFKSTNSGDSWKP